MLFWEMTCSVPISDPRDSRKVFNVVLIFEPLKHDSNERSACTYKELQIEITRHAEHMLNETTMSI
jgi:hypothetical protein